MTNPLVPYRMRMVYPQAKIIVLLRDPTDRYVEFGPGGCVQHDCLVETVPDLPLSHGHTWRQTMMKTHAQAGRGVFHPFNPVVVGVITG